MPDKTEHEKLVLACALVGGPDVARKLLAVVQAPMIADVRLARAWSALRRILATEAGPVDLIDALAAELAGDDGEAPGRVELHGLTAMVPSAANSAYYAGQVRRAYARRWLAQRTPETIERNPHADEAELLAGLEHGARHVRELLAGPGGAAPVVASAADYADAPQPAPVLWRDDPARPDATDYDAVLSVGEVAILASAGGLGKSTLVLELAIRRRGRCRLRPCQHGRLRTRRGRRPGGGGVLRGCPGPDRAPADLVQRWQGARRCPPCAGPGAAMGGGR